jgi:hypothetical protein
MLWSDRSLVSEETQPEGMHRGYSDEYPSAKKRQHDLET